MRKIRNNLSASFSPHPPCLQTCFLLAVNVIGQRMDFYAMLHAFGLIAVMYQRRRKAIAQIWPKYCCFLACMLTFQYLVCIGIPPSACSG